MPFAPKEESLTAHTSDQHPSDLCAHSLPFASQITLVDNDHIVIYDKAETNPLYNKTGGSVWGAVYSISTQKVRPLDLKTNSFCAGGGWISNGTLVSVGGNPRQQYVYSKSGLAAVRLFTPCTNDKCDVYENPSRIRLTSSRWYPSTVRLTDGSLLIAGGMLAGGYNNAGVFCVPSVVRAAVLTNLRSQRGDRQPDLRVLPAEG